MNDFPSAPLCITMKTITLKCEQCKNTFERPLKEHTRSRKLNRKSFCGLSCFGKYNNKQRPEDFGRKLYEKQKKTFDIKKFCGNRKDEFSPFRYFLARGRFSMVKHKMDVDIDLKYLKELWNAQRGICPYTGIKMILPRSTYKSNNIRTLKKASLDRIDSSKGYLKGNVEFICYGINIAKNDFTKEETKEFLRSIDFSVTHS